MRRSAWLSLAVVLMCAAAGVAGFARGRAGGPDLVVLRQAATSNGAQDGLRAGTSAGIRNGFRAGFRAGYRHAYAPAYRVVYRKALGQ